MSQFADVKEYQRFIKDKARETAELKTKVTNEYIRLYKQLPEPKDDTDLRKSLIERFDLTERRLNNILDNQHTYLNAKEQAFTSGLVMRHYVAGIQAAEQAIKALDEYDDYVCKKIDADEKWVEIEQYTSAKGSGVKAVTPREARRSILRERLDVFVKSFEPLKALAPKVVQIQDSTPQFDSLEELRKQREVLKKQLKIEEGENEAN